MATRGSLGGSHGRESQLRRQIRQLGDRIRSQPTDPVAAVADYTATYELDRSNVGAVCESAQAHQHAGGYQLVIRDYKECRGRMPDDVLPTLQLSWLLSTCPDAAARDGRRALDLAVEVCAPVTCRSPEPLNALAAAYAELGDFTRAR